MGPDFFRSWACFRNIGPILFLKIGNMNKVHVIIVIFDEYSSNPFFDDLKIVLIFKISPSPKNDERYWIIWWMRNN